MVYQDIYSQVEINKIGKTRKTAQLLDRFFSFVIDYMILTPFVMFALYIAFNNGFVYARSNPLAPENDFFYALMGVVFVVAFSLIQTFFVSVWQATPGQHFLKIRFEFNEPTSLNLLRIFCRQIGFWFSFLLLGIPFLAIMTNERRRTFYDHIADVSVVSIKTEKVFFDFENEFKYWRALSATLTMFFVFLFVSFVWNNYERVVNRVVSFNEFQSRNYFCPEMTGIEFSKRLEVAVAMNLVNQLSDACLDREADFILWKQKYDQYSLAYYAKSLTTEDEGKEARYLNQACADNDPKSEQGPKLGCKIAMAFKNNDFDTLYSSLPQNDILADVLKYELNNILDKREDANVLFAKLDKYDELRFVKKYQISELLSHDITLTKEAVRIPASVDSTDGAEVTVEAPVNVDKNEKIMELLGDL
ncbi:MAG: RDD family protein [Pseudobdellovibrio sp.]